MFNCYFSVLQPEKLVNLESFYTEMNDEKNLSFNIIMTLIWVKSSAKS